MGDHKYTLQETGSSIESFLKRICELARFKVSFTIAEGDTPHPDFENPEIVVRFTGPDVDLLLANKAEVLLALEQLTMEVLRMSSEDHSKLCFDANDYRRLRIEELRLSALTAAERVKKTKAPFHFSPMNSRERRIIHLALRDETAVRSESVGIGPTRQVVVVPADMKELPPPIIPPKPPAPGRGSDAGHGPARRGGPGRFRRR